VTPRAEKALSNLSHELKTPLAAIAGFAELMQNRDDDRTRIEGSARILEAAERLSTGIDRLLGAIAREDEAVVQRLADET
jgi:signal transduction histidine kinase